MALVPYSKDPKTKELYYYDTDELDDAEYARICELEEQLKYIVSFSERCKVYDEMDEIIRNALSRNAYTYATRR